MRVVEAKGRLKGYADIAGMTGPGLVPCVKLSRFSRRLYFDTKDKCTLEEFLREELSRERFCGLMQEMIRLCKNWEAAGVNYRKFSWALTDVYVTANGCQLQFLYLPWLKDADNQDIRRFFKQLCEKVKIPLLERGDWMEEFADRLLRQSCFTLFMLESYLDAMGNRRSEATEGTVLLEGYSC